MVSSLDMYTIKLLGIQLHCRPWHGGQHPAVSVAGGLSHAFYMAIDSVYKNGLSKQEC